MKHKVLKIKDWLIERDNKPQFEFVTEVLAKRLEDNIFFKVGETNYSTVDGKWSIHFFSLDRIHVGMYLTEEGKYGKKLILCMNDLPPYIQ
jgi:hypothetical protein